MCLVRWAWLGMRFVRNNIHKIGVAGFFWRVRKFAKSDCCLHYVCLSVRMERLGSHWMDFHDI
jgi:hypothetical protein